MREGSAAHWERRENSLILSFFLSCGDKRLSNLNNSGATQVIFISNVLERAPNTSPEQILASQRRSNSPARPPLRHSDPRAIIRKRSCCTAIMLGSLLSNCTRYAKCWNSIRSSAYKIYLQVIENDSGRRRWRTREKLHFSFLLPLFSITEIKMHSSISTFHFILIWIYSFNGTAVNFSFINHLAFPLEFMAAYHYAKIEFGSDGIQKETFIRSPPLLLLASSSRSSSSGCSAGALKRKFAIFFGAQWKLERKTKTIYINLHVSTSKFEI